MYGNFDAIKRRQKLRKEKIDLSTNRLEKRKNNLISNQSDRLGKKHSDAEVQKAIKEINSKNKERKRKNFLPHLIMWIVSFIIFAFLVWLII